jgi:hypothetical protein
MAALTAPALLGGQPTVTRAQVNCDFTLGFRTLRDLIVAQHGDIVGACRENEWHNAENGDGLQQTTGGLMVWRKADNWTAFTNGSITWINGPFGLQNRPNDQRFAWEAPLPVPAPSAAGGTAAGGSVAPTATPAPGAPSLQLRLSDDRVDQDETFTLILEANDPAGLSSLWWWASGTDDDELRDTHTQDCNGATPCRRTWEVSTDEAGDVTFHAVARNISGVESGEVSLELRVRDVDQGGGESNNNNNNDNGGNDEAAATPTPTATATATRTPVS